MMYRRTTHQQKTDNKTKAQTGFELSKKGKERRYPRGQERISRQGKWNKIQRKMLV